MRKLIFVIVKITDITALKRNVIFIIIRGEDDDSKRGLLMVTLSLIFMSGNVITDSKCNFYHNIKI